MWQGWRIARRAGMVALALAAFVVCDATAAVAQSVSCMRLNSQLAALDRNSDFRNADRSSDDVRALQSNLQDAQSAYVRGGCLQAQQQGFPQTPECRSYARQYLLAQQQLKKVQQSVSNGDDISQQREYVLQQIARFGCNQRSSQARFLTEDDNSQPVRRPRSFFDELFGPPPGTDDYGDSNTYDGQEQVEDPYANQGGGNTIRTVCVRMSDGYYWPISYATVRDYIPQDAQTCQAACPGQQVDLYFYNNPGQEPEQMINAEGQAYTSLPAAFAYRKQIDLTNSCKPQQVAGQITVDDVGNGMTRAMVSYDGDKFPLPVRDPRRPEQATAAAPQYASVVDVPLPRPRPSATVTAAASTPPPESVVSAQNRIVKVGDKVVRVVGPDTPYAPSTSSGTSGSSG